MYCIVLPKYKMVGTNDNEKERERARSAPLSDAVREWARCSVAVDRLSAELAKLREKKRIWAERCMSANPAALEASGCPIRIVERNRFEPLTFTFMRRSLLQCIEDENAVEEIVEHVRSSRRVTRIKDIAIKGATGTSKAP